MRSALKSPRLRRIIIAYTVNRLGTWFGLVALAVAVFDHTHSALSVAALLFAGEALPALIVPVIVARIETTRVRSDLSALYFFEALVTCTLAILLWHFWLPAVLLLVALDGTAALTASALLRTEVARVARSQIESASERGLAANSRAERSGVNPSPDHQAHEAEREANAALNIAFSTTFVLGPAIGGAVVAGAGASAALFIDVGSFLAGAVLLLDVHRDLMSTSTESVRDRLRDGWHHITGSPLLRGVLLAEAAALIFIQSGGPIEVTYVKATLNAGDRGLGLLLAAWGAGSVVGSLIFARLLHRSLGALLSVGTVAIASAYFGLAVAPSLPLACVAGLLGGIGNGIQWPSLISTVQRLTPQQLHGRLMSVVESVSSLCLAVGLPLGGVLVAISSPRAAFWIVGAGAVFATAGLARVTITKATEDGELPNADQEASESRQAEGTNSAAALGEPSLL